MSLLHPDRALTRRQFEEHNVAEAQHGLTIGEYIAKTDRADQLVSRAMMEYPTIDVSLVYLMSIGKIQNFWGRAGWQGLFHVTVDPFTDKAVEGVGGNFANLVGRFQDIYNYYCVDLYTPRATEDFHIVLVSAGTGTDLAVEGVDLEDRPYKLKLGIVGTTLYGYREDMTTPVISATDTTFASGYYGPRESSESWGMHLSVFSGILRAPSTPRPKPIAYFEVPIIGTGKPDDLFRAKMPEEIIDDPVLGRRNLLALSHSSLIPIDRRTGKPIHGTALVRIFEQPDRDPALRDIPTCLDALRAITGVTELAIDNAKLLAKQLDDRLRDGEIKYMFNPTPENELWSLLDFYEREVINLKRIDPTKIPDFDLLMDRYAERSKKIGRTDLADKFRALKRR